MASNKSDKGKKRRTSQTYHATMLVTRAEQWCVDATSDEEARALLEAGEGHRCSPGEIFSLELGKLL
jgi:hypothetical protein